MVAEMDTRWWWRWRRDRGGDGGCRRRREVFGGGRAIEQQVVNRPSSSKNRPRSRSCARSPQLIHVVKELPVACILENPRRDRCNPAGFPKDHWSVLRSPQSPLKSYGPVRDPPRARGSKTRSPDSLRSPTYGGPFGPLPTQIFDFQISGFQPPAAAITASSDHDFTRSPKPVSPPPPRQLGIPSGDAVYPFLPRDTPPSITRHRLDDVRWEYDS